MHTFKTNTVIDFGANVNLILWHKRNKSQKKTRIIRGILRSILLHSLVLLPLYLKFEHIEDTKQTKAPQTFNIMLMSEKPVNIEKTQISQPTYSDKVMSSNHSIKVEKYTQTISQNIYLILNMYTSSIKNSKQFHVLIEVDARGKITMAKIQPAVFETNIQNEIVRKIKDLILPPPPSTNIEHYSIPIFILR